MKKSIDRTKCYILILFSMMYIQSIAQEKVFFGKDSFYVYKANQLEKPPMFKFNDSCIRNVKANIQCPSFNVNFTVVVDSTGKIPYYNFEFNKKIEECLSKGSKTAKQDLINQLDCLLGNITECKPGVKNNRPINSIVVNRILIRVKQ